MTVYPPEITLTRTGFGANAATVDRKKIFRFHAFDEANIGTRIGCKCESRDGLSHT
jgi:hypothetical protein